MSSTLLPLVEEWKITGIRTSLKHVISYSCYSPIHTFASYITTLTIYIIGFKNIIKKCFLLAIPEVMEYKID